MKSFTAIVTLLAFTASFNSVESIQECTGWDLPLALFNGNCYKIFNKESQIEFEDAEEQCKSIGGHLASVHSDEENTVLLGLNYDIEAFWLGGFNDNNKWAWTDGTDFDYNHDYLDQGSSSFIVTNEGVWYANTGYYDDGIKAFACKKSAHLLQDTGYLHSRKGCPNDDSTILATLEEASASDCQNLCSSDEHFGKCQSFEYKHKSEKCILRSSPVADISDCQVITGRDQPSLEDIEQVNCKDFYRSDCTFDEEDINNVSTPSDCQFFCNDNFHGCSHWTLNNSTCTLYFYNTVCHSIVGPTSPSVDICLS